MTHFKPVGCMSFLFFLFTAFFSPAAQAIPVMLFDNYGGTYHDAEKSPTNTEDDLMCWAGSAANLLAWSGWGFPSGESFTNEDDIFQYFQAHWTDKGGHAYYGIDWWFDGTNDTEGWADWSQVDLAGGGFWTSDAFSSHSLYSGSDLYAMNNLAYLTTNGYAVSVGVTDDAGAHAITAWGFELDPFNNLIGIWVTDSDDDKNMTNPPDALEYYDVTLTSGKWFLQNFYGDDDDWYINDVFGLEQKPVPEPGTLVLFGLGLLVSAGVIRKKQGI